MTLSSAILDLCDIRTIGGVWFGGCVGVFGGGVSVKTICALGGDPAFT